MHSPLVKTGTSLKFNITAAMGHSMLKFCQFVLGRQGAAVKRTLLRIKKTEVR
jgi:hypothetical protein